MMMRSKRARLPDGQGEARVIRQEECAFTDAVTCSDVNLEFGPHLILSNVNLRVGREEILTVIGPSGCGKSTLLNAIAGVVRITSGEIRCRGEVLRGLNRHVAYMTQKDTLLAWRKGIDNAALPLEIKGLAKAERYGRARAAMAQVGIPEAENRRPHELSGGMRSRLSLARTLLTDADILLMDEPFAAVDALRRVQLQRLLLEIWQATRKTLVYVTHDLNEAIALGHRVIVMGRDPGRVVLDREIPIEHPRDVARVRSEPVAIKLYNELWETLEEQVSEHVGDLDNRFGLPSS